MNMYQPWVSLVAQMVKNLPAVQEIWVQCLGLENPLEKKQLPTPVFLPGEFHGQRRLVGCSPRDHRESDRTERLTLSLAINSFHYTEMFPSIPTLVRALKKNHEWILNFVKCSFCI